jgi:diguanylate cyclase (GGDEF)-like protein
MQNEASENAASFSVLVLDIDHFKNINDQYGHSAGDQVLQQVAEVINMNIRQDDIAARWGGEEFLIILPYADETKAYCAGERIRSAIERSNFQINGSENIQLSVSVGISAADTFERDYNNVVLRADQGMYEAKFAGRNRTVIKSVG